MSEITGSGFWALRPSFGCCSRYAFAASSPVEPEGVVAGRGSRRRWLRRPRAMASRSWPAWHSRNRAGRESVHEGDELPMLAEIRTALWRTPSGRTAASGQFPMGESSASASMPHRRIGSFAMVAGYCSIRRAVACRKRVGNLAIERERRRLHREKFALYDGCSFGGR